MPITHQIVLLGDLLGRFAAVVQACLGLAAAAEAVRNGVPVQHLEHVLVRLREQEPVHDALGQDEGHGLQRGGIVMQGSGKRRGFGLEGV